MQITVRTNINLPDDMVGKINQIWLVNSTQMIIRQARENAPYDTGKLKQSINKEPNNITTSTDEVRVWPRKVVYSVKREFVNKKNPHRKFYMKRTHDSSPPIVKEEFEKAVKIIINSL